MSHNVRYFLVLFPILLHLVRVTYVYKLVMKSSSLVIKNVRHWCPLTTEEQQTSNYAEDGLHSSHRTSGKANQDLVPWKRNFKS